jgi:hypothetical protein
VQLILKFSNFKFQQGSFTACVILCGCQLSSSDHSLSSFFNNSVLIRRRIFREGELMNMALAVGIEFVVIVAATAAAEGEAAAGRGV